jgi:hypothetical protein
MVWCGPLHLAFPDDVTYTFNKWRKKEENENKEVTLHILTHGGMRGCGLTSWVVCINDKLHDIRKRNVTIRSEI